jgi:hypothetical protein
VGSSCYGAAIRRRPRTQRQHREVREGRGSCSVAGDKRREPSPASIDDRERHDAAELRLVFL